MSPVETRSLEEWSSHTPGPFTMKRRAASTSGIQCKWSGIQTSAFYDILRSTPVNAGEITRTGIIPISVGRADSWDHRVICRLAYEEPDLLDEHLGQLMFRNLAHHLPLFEEDALTSTPGNPDVGLPCLARAVDHAAHDGDFG